MDENKVFPIFINMHQIVQDLNAKNTKSMAESFVMLVLIHELADCVIRKTKLIGEGDSMTSEEQKLGKTDIGYSL